MQISSEKWVLCLWVLSLPLLLAWGFGATHPALDFISIPGAILMSLPGQLGVYGLAGFLLLSLLCWHNIAGLRKIRGLLLLAGGLSAISLVASCLALARPILLLAFLPLALHGFRSPSSEVWSPRWLNSLLGASLCWAFCVVLPPSGPVFIGDVLEAPLVELLRPLPEWSRQVLSLAALGLMLIGLLRHSRPPASQLLVGGLSGVILDASLGTPLSAFHALGFGVILVAWRLPLGPALKEPARLALPLVAVAGLVGLSTGLTQRWLCPEAQTEDLRFLSEIEGATDIAMSPGNMPFILLLREDPPRLERVAATGVVSESVELDLPGGALFAMPGLGANFVRLVDGESKDWVELWSPASMELLATIPLPDGCDPAEGSVPENSSDFVILCRNGRLLGLEALGRSVQPVGDLERTVQGYDGASLPVRTSGGPSSRLLLESKLSGSKAALGSLLIGPWSGRARLTPGGLLVTRGPLGWVEVRGEDPLWSLGIGAPPSEGAARQLDEARNVLDGIRVPGWPSELLWSPRQAATWVTSMNSGDISLVDSQVTWHRHSINVGPVPRRVSVDVVSGRLFGLNQCGLFEARIASTFPWESSGDVEEDPTTDPGKAEK